MNKLIFFILTYILVGVAYAQTTTGVNSTTQTTTDQNTTTTNTSTTNTNTNTNTNTTANDTNNTTNTTNTNTNTNTNNNTTNTNTNSTTNTTNTTNPTSYSETTVTNTQKSIPEKELPTTSVKVITPTETIVPIPKAERNIPKKIIENLSEATTSDSSNPQLPKLGEDKIIVELPVAPSIIDRIAQWLGRGVVETPKRDEVEETPVEKPSFISRVVNWFSWGRLGQADVPASDTSTGRVINPGEKARERGLQEAPAERSAKRFVTGYLNNCWVDAEADLNGEMCYVHCPSFGQESITQVSCARLTER